MCIRDSQQALAGGYNLNPVLLLPIVVVVVVCVLKLPALPGLAISVGCGVLFGAVFQGITNVSDIFNILHYGTTFESSNELANNLLSRGGMDHQMWTIKMCIRDSSYRFGIFDINTQYQVSISYIDIINPSAAGFNSASCQFPYGII